RNIGLVYGGGKVGLMGVLAEEMLRLGGEVHGVIPEKLMGWELGHTGITKLHVVDTMHDRKAMMADLSDAFIAMPGGIGTLEEFIEVFTWLQLDYHQKPCALYNPNNYFDKFMDFFQHMIDEGFLSRKIADTLIIESDIEILMSRILSYPT
ncbi:unnamed protein product, partial [Chrysoparadoxa australica]